VTEDSLDRLNWLCLLLRTGFALVQSHHAFLRPSHRNGVPLHKTLDKALANQLECVPSPLALPNQEWDHRAVEHGYYISGSRI
jgi:hypothetical protein